MSLVFLENLVYQFCQNSSITQRSKIWKSFSIPEIKQILEVNHLSCPWEIHQNFGDLRRNFSWNQSMQLHQMQMFLKMGPQLMLKTKFRWKKCYFAVNFISFTLSWQVKLEVSWKKCFLFFCSFKGLDKTYFISVAILRRGKPNLYLIWQWELGHNYLKYKRYKCIKKTLFCK